MKDLSLLIWLTQLGLSVAFPLAGFVLLGVWLHQSVGWGAWSVWGGIFLGLVCAVTGFRDCLKALDRLTGGKNKKQPPQGFNNHI